MPVIAKVLEDNRPCELIETRIDPNMAGVCTVPTGANEQPASYQQVEMVARCGEDHGQGLGGVWAWGKR